ncbi:MAG: universal stress protein [Crocinitomicaceae bacterium]|nr:universal stress protein [Crocinitomicaceae bacterium]
MKTITFKKYLVPYDFTKFTKDAYEYAVSLCKQTGGEIILLHLVGEESEIPSAERDIKEYIDRHDKDIQEMTTFRVMKGDIYSDINQIAETADASLVVLGKHHNNLFQEIFGSDAMKVASHSHLPFLIVQDTVQKETIDKILLPFNYQRESLQVTQMAASMAKQFDATIYLAGFQDTDDSLYREMRVNQAIIEKYLKKENIHYLSIPIPGGKAYSDLIMTYAKNNDMDLIAASYLDFGFKSFFHSFIDELLTKQSQIPVLTVNGPEVMNHSPKLNYVPV